MTRGPSWNGFHPLNQRLFTDQWKRSSAVTIIIIGMPDMSKMKKPDVKVVLLGDMNVGKTSLLHRYMERKFKDTISTVGGAFFLKQWGPYNISIWDTAGNEPSRAHLTFLSFLPPLLHQEWAFFFFT